MKTIEILRGALVCGLVLALAACGAGGGSTVATGGDGVGTGGTGASFGTVTGFGSLVVDGKAYSSATSLYYAGSDAEEAARVSAIDVELGDRLEVRLDAAGNPSTVVVEPDLTGTVEDFGAGGFSINGVAVRVNTDPSVGPVTYYNGFLGYADLAGNPKAEVHGVFGVDPATGQGYVRATLIERMPAGSPVLRISGVVTALDPAGGSFRIGSRKILYGAATGLLPAGMALAEGMLVNVWSNTAPGADGSLDAGVIRIRTLVGIGGPVQLSGLVHALGGTRFEVSGLPVDGSALPAVLAGLHVGDYVVVSGSADAASGLVAASAIQVFDASHPVQVELHGTVTGFVDSGNFLVRGVPVDARSASFDGLGADSLKNEVYVEIRGSVVGNRVLARSVSIQQEAPEDSTVDYQGRVSQYDAATSSFTLTLADGSTRAIRLAANVAFDNGSAADLVDGASVEVEGTRTVDGLTVYGVEFQNLGAGGGGDSLETQGLIYDYDPAAASFRINGLTIHLGAASVPDGFADGVKAEVEFVLSGGLNVATEIALYD